MARFAYVRKVCIYAKFAYVCKSGHVYMALCTLCLLAQVVLTRCDWYDVYAMKIQPLSVTSKRNEMANRVILIFASVQKRIRFKVNDCNFE